MTSPSPRAILAANLRGMIAHAGKSGEKMSVRAWALGKGLDVRMIDRMVNGKHAVTIDSLDKVADACGLKSWQLLLEDLDPAAPQDAPMTDAERAMLKRLRSILSE